MIPIMETKLFDKRKTEYRFNFNDLSATERVFLEALRAQCFILEAFAGTKYVLQFGEIHVGMCDRLQCLDARWWFEVKIDACINLRVFERETQENLQQKIDRVKHSLGSGIQGGGSISLEAAGKIGD